MITYTKGNGSSMNEAIKITGAHGEFDGIESEYNLVTLIFKIIKKDWRLLPVVIL